MTLDRTDLAMIAILQREGRIAVVELAKRVNLSATPCALRLRRLERDGVIAGYQANVPPEALDQTLLAFVQVNLKATDEATLQAFNRAIGPVEEVMECHMVGGGFDYLLKVRVRDMAAFRELLGSVIGALPMVENSHSYFVMQPVKEISRLPLPRPVARRRGGP